MINTPSKGSSVSRSMFLETGAMVTVFVSEDKNLNFGIGRKHVTMHMPGLDILSNILFVK